MGAIIIASAGAGRPTRNTTISLRLVRDVQHGTRRSESARGRRKKQKEAPLYRMVEAIEDTPRRSRWPEEI